MKPLAVLVLLVVVMTSPAIARAGRAEDFQRALDEIERAKEERERAWADEERQEKEEKSAKRRDDEDRQRARRLQKRKGMTSSMDVDVENLDEGPGEAEE